MADFQFRTRGQQSPQGKQRVYFTCHPDDFERFFEEIQKEILDRQDCAVFYLEPGIQPEDVEDYELRLREMQLFVVPVTTKMLTRANRAMDVEVPFAFEHHIPILPLMQERGLDDVFNKKFGDLQYLDKHNADPTAIPYEKKLTKYLESVIVGDELAKKVRAAFDAYIFLSYRKKDRKYAQELMKLIHSNPLCRDIAIWYDEFLTPGENFNEAIRSALEKSELFALAVTPNLINEINYILTTEYPMARDLGKTILPAEMEQTDREKLQSMYDAIPELIEKGDTTALADRLSRLFESLVIRENDIDPQHNFFIGLAYLGGIDVEVNHERAVELITCSAEQSFIPAIKKLVSMYNSGEGVKRDNQKVIEWQTKRVELTKSKYYDSPNAETAIELLSCLHELGDYYLELNKLFLAENTFYQMLEFSSQFESKYNNQNLLHSVATSFERLGSLKYLQSDTIKSKEYFLKCRDVVNAFFEKTHSIESVYDNIIILHRLGKLLLKEKNYTESYNQYYTSMRYAEFMVKEFPSIRAFRYLSLSYTYLGNVSKAQKKLQAAEEWYHKSLEIDATIEKETGTIEAHLDLSISYYQLGNIAQAQGNLSEAEAWYVKSLPILEKVANETGNQEFCQDLWVMYDRLIDLSADDKITIYQKRLEAFEKIAQKTRTEQALHYLFKSYEKYFYSVFSDDTIDVVSTQCQRVVAIHENVANETDTLQTKRLLVDIYLLWVYILCAQERTSEAEQVYRKSIDIFENLAETTNKKEDYDYLASMKNELGRMIKDRVLLEESVSIWQRLSHQYPENSQYKGKYEDALETLKKLFQNNQE